MLFQPKVYSAMLGIFCIVTSLSLISADVHRTSSVSNQNRRRTVSDPVSNLFSELGDLILNVDEAFSVQTAPKVEQENRILSEILRPTTDYFDRIQKNYKNMQKRLGRLIGNVLGPKNTYSDHELSTVAPPSAGPMGFTSNLSPGVEEEYNPFTTSDKRKSSIQKTSEIVDLESECSNEVLADPILEQRRIEKCGHLAVQRARSVKKQMFERKGAIKQLSPVESKAVRQQIRGYPGKLRDISSESGETSVSEDKYLVEGKSEKGLDFPNECSADVLADPILEYIRKERCARLTAELTAKKLKQIILDSDTTEEIFVPMSSTIFDQLSKSFMRRQGDMYDAEKPEGRIIGDLLYSESQFDKTVRQFLKEHGKWILDNPLLNRWRQPSENKEVPTTTDSEITETSAEITPDETKIDTTEDYTPTSKEYEVALSMSEEVLPEDDVKSSSYYRIVNENGDVVEDEIDIVLEPLSPLVDDIETIAEEQKEPDDIVILAFTSDGIPLKLRVGPEIDNPLGYLHKVLKSAGVTLNVPVVSYDDLEPVGSEVLKLGSGILTRAVYINASNKNELKTLLKTLMRSNSSGTVAY